MDSKASEVTLYGGFAWQGGKRIGEITTLDVFVGKTKLDFVRVIIELGDADFDSSPFSPNNAAGPQ